GSILESARISAANGLAGWKRAPATVRSAHRAGRAATRVARVAVVVDRAAVRGWAGDGPGAVGQRRHSAAHGAASTAGARIPLLAHAAARLPLRLTAGVGVAAQLFAGQVALAGDRTRI